MSSRLCKFAATFVLLLIFAIPSGQGRADSLTIEKVLSMRYPREVVISPDGKYVAFTVTLPDFNNSVWLTQIYTVKSDGSELRQFTEVGKRNFSPQWSPDSKLLAFLSTRSGDGTFDAQQVWIMPIDGGEAKLLTHSPTGVEEFRWSHSGKWIAYVAEREPTTEEKNKEEFNKKYGFDATVVGKLKPPRDIWIADLATGESKKILNGDAGISNIEFSPDDRLIVYQTNYTGEYNDEQKYDLWLVDVKRGLTGGEKNKPEQLTNFPGPETKPQFSPDGKLVAYISQTVPDVEFAETDVSIISLRDRSVRNLTSTFDKAVTEYAWDVRSGQRMKIWFVAAEGTQTHLYTLSPPVAGQSSEIMKVTEGDANYQTISRTADGATWCMVKETATTLPEIVVLAKGRQSVITHFSDQLSPYKLGEQSVVRWEAPDKRFTIEGVLVKPVDYQPGKRYPLILTVHGGPYGRFRNTFLQSYYPQLFAQEGYMVLAPNPRGSSGYTDAFGQANRYDLGGGDYRDIMAGVDYLIQQGFVDSTRMGVTGGSYGGYMTNWIISQTPRFKAAVSMYGIFSLFTDFSNSWQPSWEVMYFGMYYWEKPINMENPYVRHSPAFYVQNIVTPTLILQGEDDEYTNISNSREMYVALKYRNVPVEFVVYPREGHGIGNEPNHRVDTVRRAHQWFRKYVIRGDG